jgi:hypothetical protein
MHVHHRDRSNAAVIFANGTYFLDNPRILCVQQSSTQAFDVGKSQERIFHTKKLQNVLSRICIQSVSGGIVNILEDGSMEDSE